MYSGSFPTLSTLIATSTFFLTSNLLPAQQAGASSNQSSDLLPSSAFVANSSLPVSRPLPLKEGATTPSAIVPARTATSASQSESTPESLTRLLDYYRQSGNRMAEANTHCAIASSYNALGRRQAAVEQYQSALVIWRGLGNKESEALTLTLIGDVYRVWGFSDQAVRFYRDAIRIFPVTTNIAGEAAAMNELGIAYFVLRDRKKCLDSLKQALTSFQALHNRRGEAYTLVNLGTAYGFLGNDPHRALDLFQEALTKLELLDDRPAQANAQDILGLVWMKLKNPEMATLSFQHALSLYSGIGDAQGRETVIRHMKTHSGTEIIALNH